MDKNIRKKLLENWHYEKNKERGIFPEDIDTYKGKITWRCDKGHIYAKTVESQLKYGIICARCRPLCLVDDAELLALYDFEKNDADPKTIHLNSNTKYWWKDDTGKSCFRSVYRMKDSKIKIPENRIKLIDNSSLASEYDCEKNDIPVEKVGFYSKRKYYWKCKKGHEWYGYITTNKAAKSACKECKKEETKIRNGKIKEERQKQKEEEYTEKGISQKRIPKEKVEFTTIPIEPEWNKEETIEFKDSLAGTDPEIAKYWNYKKNIGKTPSTVKGEMTSVPFWWRCEKGHEWIGTIRSMKTAKTHVCSICGKQKFEYQI